MAIEIFLRVDGITGGSRNYHHKGWSDVIAWNWDLGRAGDDGATGAAAMNEMSLTKAVGPESPELMNLFVEGTLIKSAQLSVVPVVGKREAQQKYLAISLEDVVIRALRTGGNAEDSFFCEHLALTFARVRYEFHQNAEGGTTGGATSAAASFAFAWDAAARARW